MRIFRFDEDVSIPISEFDSRFRIGPLTGLDSRVRVQLMYLPREGLIGRHPTATRQFLGVITGRGWVSGHDDERRDVGPGYGALWEPGEEHETGSDDGMTAICIAGHFDVWALGVT